MNLHKMQPSVYDGSGSLIHVITSCCNKEKSAPNVWCDLDAKAGTYYCQDCSVRLMLDAHQRAERVLVADGEVLPSGEWK